jgi:hypothetical protein
MWAEFSNLNLKQKILCLWLSHHLKVINFASILFPNLLADPKKEFYFYCVRFVRVWGPILCSNWHFLVYVLLECGAQYYAVIGTF